MRPGLGRRTPQNQPEAPPELRGAQQLPVDHIGQPPLQAPQRLLVALPRSAFPPVVVPTRRVVTDLGDRHDMKRIVQLPVPRPGQPVPNHVAGRQRNRRGAGSPAARPTRPHPRSPTAPPATARRTDAAPDSSPDWLRPGPSSAAATTRPPPPQSTTACADQPRSPPDPLQHSDATPNLLHDSQQKLEETAHRLRAKQASLQPLTSTAMTGMQAKNSQPRWGDRCEPSDPGHRLGDHSGSGAATACETCAARSWARRGRGRRTHPRGCRPGPGEQATPDPVSAPILGLRQ
jgi:hypothetical protein